MTSIEQIETHWVLADKGLRSFATTTGLTAHVMGAYKFPTKGAATQWLGSVTPYKTSLRATKVQFIINIG